MSRAWAPWPRRRTPTGRASSASRVARTRPPSRAWLRERRTAAFARFVERGPADAAGRGVAPHADRRRSRARASSRPIPGARPPADALDRLARAASTGRGSSSSTAALSRELSVARAGTPGVELSACATRCATHAARARAGARPRGRGDDRRFADLNTAFAEDAAVVLDRAGARSPSSRSASRTSAAGDGPAASPTRARSSWPAAAAEPASSRRYAGARRPRPTSSNAVTEVVLEDGARVDHYKLQQEGARRAPRRDARRARSAATRASATTRSRSAPRSRATTSTCASTGEGGECVLDGLFVRRRPARRRHPLADRPRAAALHEPRALQGHPRRPGARRLQRPRRGAAGRAEDRRRGR